MENLFLEEDWEREMDKESIYLQEAEHDTWLWIRDWMMGQEGQVITEQIEEEEFEHPLPF